MPTESNRPDLTEPGDNPRMADSAAETRIIGGEGDSSRVLQKRSSPQVWVGRQLGKYEVTAVLGVGGMGVVLRGHDEAIDRDVAIKVLPSELSNDQVALNRFLAEARSAGKLNHPHTVTIYEIGQEQGVNYLAMELVAGGSAADDLEKRGAYSVAEATRLVSEACQGLAAAHQQGIVHRDIKPANLLLTDDKSVKVSDFGLAKRAQNTSLQMTQAGQIVGTPYYMSPEQCESRPVDSRSDIYSLGATYYSLLTGKSPYEESGSVVQVMFAHCHAERPDPRMVSASVPAACAEIISRAMATNPAERYQSMEEMRRDLEAVLAALSGMGIRLPSQALSKPPVAAVVNAPAALPAKRNWLAWGAGAVSLLVVAGFVGASLLNGSRGGGTAAVVAPVPESSPQPAVPVIPVPTGEPIKVGILHSLTGNMASSESPVVDATLLAIEKLNEQGGVLGRLVEAVVADGESDPNVFAQEAQRLIAQEKVSTIFGCWTSASRKTVLPVVEAANHLLMYPVQYEGIEESPCVVYTGAAPNQQIIPAVKWVYAFQGKRRFFLVGSDYVFPRVAHEIIKDQLKELGGHLAGEEFLPLGSLEVHDVIEKIKEAKPDVILNSINGDTNTAFFHELRKAGITPQMVPTVSFSIGEEELRHLKVASMAGDYAAWNYFQAIDSPENKEFITEFRKKYGPKRVVTDPMEAAYFGVKLWAQAVAAAGTLTPPEIRTAIHGQKRKAPEGEVTIDAATQHTYKTPRIGRVQPDGQFAVVWTATDPEQPVPFPPSRTREQWESLLQELYTRWGNRWAPPEQ